MESSEQISSSSDTPHQRWAGILGIIVAIITLTLPLSAIGYYSSLSINAETIPQGIERVPNPKR